jgi:hypothetical protein
MARARSLDNIVACALALAALELALQAFRVRAWEEAGLRVLIIAVLAAGMVLVRAYRPAAAPLATGARVRFALRAAVLAALLWNAGLGAIAIRHTATTGEIRMDQGQATYKAATELRHGENPYGRNELLDPYAYIARLPLREKLGVGPRIEGGAAAAAASVWSYWGSLDPALRDRLLPRAAPGASAAAVHETETLGYKYGPLPLLVTAGLTPLLGPLAVAAVNVALVFALFFVSFLILRAHVAEAELAALAFIAILIDHFPTWYYVHFSNSDAWPMLFCALSLYAAGTGRTYLLGAALGLALASKPFPSLLYVPLLLSARSWRAAIVALLLAGALMLPFWLWDPRGFANNYLLWSAYMLPDDTSWIQRVPFGIALAVRLALGTLVAFLWLRLIRGREMRIFASFALMSLAIVAAGPVIHNNYVPWFSLWAAVAVAECFSPVGPQFRLGFSDAADARMANRSYTSRP